MSDYFDAAGNRISDGLTARAADVNTLRDEVGAGFDLLPSVEDITLGITNYAVDTGVANAYVVAPAAVTAYADGLPDFETKYFEMLKAGGSKHHKELLAPFGLDASDPKFWDKGLSMIAGFIDELEAMEG